MLISYFKFRFKSIYFVLNLLLLRYLFLLISNNLPIAILDLKKMKLNDVFILDVKTECFKTSSLESHLKIFIEE